MRTPANQAQIEAAEANWNFEPRMYVTVRNDLYKFTKVGEQTGHGMDTAIASSASIATASWGCLAGYTTGGNLKIAELDYTGTATKFTVNSPNTTGVDLGQNASLRGSFDDSGYYYYATWTPGTYPDIKKGRIASAGATWSTANYSSAQIPVTMLSGSGLVRRIDAVSYTPDGVLVQIGSYNFTLKLATKTFWLVTMTNVYQLESIVQHDITDTYSSVHATISKSASFAGAISAANNTIIALTNDSRRALTFTIRNKVEGQMTPVIPIDPLASDHSFLGASIVKYGSKYLLSGKSVRPFSDKTSVSMSIYLGSSDGKSWSIGEWSSFITSQAYNQCIVTPSTASFGFVYSYGDGAVFKSDVRWGDKFINDVDITDNVIEASIEQGTNAADSLRLVMHSRTKITSIVPGSVIAFQSGYVDLSNSLSLCDIGQYVVDGVPTIVTNMGRQTLEVSCIDKASWHLSSWNSPTDIDRWSQTRHEDAFADSAKVIFQTPQRDIDVTAGSFHVAALNDPAVCYAPTRDPRDGMSKLTARFTTNDTYCLPNIGLIFGASDTKFNAAIIPVPGTWTGHNQNYIKVLTSNLDPAAGFELVQRSTGTLESTLPGAFTRLMTHPQPSASGSDVYYALSSYTPTVDTDYTFSMRKAGRNIQVYAKRVDRTAAGMVGAALVEHIGQFSVNENFKMNHDGKWGFLANTDVVAVDGAFSASEYQDIEVSLSDAQDSQDYTRVLSSTGTKSTTDYRIEGGYVAGMDLSGNTWVRVYRAGVWQAYAKITAGSASPNWIDISVIIPVTVNVGDTLTVYGLGTTSDQWGWASSGISIIDTYGSIPVENDNGATKLNRISGGWALFIDQSNTAASKRVVDSDGVYHALKSGSTYTGGSHNAWDPTNPIPNGSVLGYGGSSPQVWRMILHYNRLFRNPATAYGLPSGNASTRYMIKGDEVMRYRDETWLKPGELSSVTECLVPTYYAPISAVSGATITQWRSGANQPGDDMGTVANVAGLLAEITARNAVDSFDSKQYYAVSQAAGTPPTVTINEAYPGQVTNLEAILCLSGRGQLKSQKSTHTEADGPLCYYPATSGATTKAKDFIRLSRFDYQAGLFNSIEDDLRYVCALAGADTTFASKATFSTTLSSIQTIAADEQDFVMEFDAHLFRNSSNKQLRIAFRNNYYLDLSTDNSASGDWGTVINAWLSAPNSTITQGAYAAKYLEKAQVLVCRHPVFGTLAGASYTDVPANTAKFRLIVKKNTVTLEMEGAHVWFFNLEDYNYDTSSNYFRTSGPVTAQYLSSGSATFSGRFQELSAEIENHIIDMGSNGFSALSFITGDRHMWSRVNTDGSLYWSSFTTRTDAGSVGAYVLEDSRMDALNEPSGHVNISGAEFGEHVDEGWISANGYRFVMGSNRLLDTVSDSVQEAKFMLRLSKEASQSTQIGYGRMYILKQPEDKIAVGFTNTGDIASTDIVDMVINRIGWTQGNGTYSGNMSLRKYYAS